MNEIDIYNILIKGLKIKLEVEPMVIPIGNSETTYGERRVGNRVIAKLLLGEEVISQDTVELIN